MKLPYKKDDLNRYRCHCDLCTRSRKFERIINRLKKRDREWMDHLYNYFFDIEAELELIRASKKRSKT